MRCKLAGVPQAPAWTGAFMRAVRRELEAYFAIGELTEEPPHLRDE